ncbi:MAG: signal peptidase II [Acidobacteriota bacterium]
MSLLSSLPSPWWLLALGVTVADQWSKWWIEVHLPVGSHLPVLSGFLHLTHLKNPGFALGWLADAPPALLLILAMAAFGVTVYLFTTTPRRYPLALACFALLVGGAAGNLLDRLAVGEVTDWARFLSPQLPTFNLADAAISLSLIGLVATLARARRADSPPSMES